MFYIDKLVNLVLNHTNKLLLFATVIFTIIMGGGDVPPDEIGG